MTDTLLLYQPTLGHDNKPNQTASGHIVYYSLVATPIGHSRGPWNGQIVQSFRSLRKYNKSIPVHPFHYGELPIELAQEAERHAVVVHSMGGLIVRSWFQDHDDLRVRRLVMLGTPNRGAEMADMLRRNAAYRLIMGPAGQQLVTGNNSPIARLPVPPCEFAVIAGGRGSDGYNPLVPGDNDLIVSVESTRLPGASDFLMVRAMHHFLTSNPEAIDATVRYLQSGHFRKNGVRKPIVLTANEERTADSRTK